MILPCFLLAEPLKPPVHVLGFVNEYVKHHPGHYPFPTDLTFRKYADHIVDQVTESFDPGKVQKGDTIYLSDFFIPWFIIHVHPKIKHPYILISNDSDSYHPEPGILDFNEKHGWPPPVQATRTLLYDEKVAAWFCKNMLFSRHPKIVQIPIGPTIIYWNSFYSEFHTYLEYSTRHDFEKTHLAFLALTPNSHPSRPLIIDHFGKKPYVYQAQLNKNDFIEAMTHSMFTFAPPGYGPDTVRVWEAFYLDCIPIVKHFELDDLYSDLPVLFVHNWEDVNEDLLIKKYAEIKHQPHKMEKRFFDYWQDKIKTCQEKVRKGDNNFSTIEATKFNSETLQQISSVLNKFKKSNHDRLLTLGAGMGFRPFQIVQQCPFIEHVIVQDKWGAWGHEQPLQHLKPYSNDPLLKLEKKGVAISFWDNPYKHLYHSASKMRLNIFYDLNYIRCHLLEDLDQGYQNGIKETVFLGNLYNDPYVQEILGLFMKKYPVKIEHEGDIWYFLKQHR